VVVRAGGVDVRAGGVVVRAGGVVVRAGGVLARGACGARDGRTDVGGSCSSHATSTSIVSFRFEAGVFRERGTFSSLVLDRRFFGGDALGGGSFFEDMTTMVAHHRMAAASQETGLPPMTA
jgi:hypothetical protein